MTANLSARRPDDYGPIHPWNPMKRKPPAKPTKPKAPTPDQGDSMSAHFVHNTADLDAPVPTADGDKSMDPATILVLVQTIVSVVGVLKELFKKKTPKMALAAPGPIVAADVKQVLDGGAALLRLIGARVDDPRMATVIAAIASLSGQEWFLNLVLVVANSADGMGESDVHAVLGSLARPPA